MAERPLESGRKDSLGRPIKVSGAAAGDSRSSAPRPPAPGARLSLRSTSDASDGAFVAISEIGWALSEHKHRLIGGVAVVLHQERLGLTDLPVRATADADFGVPPFVLKDESVFERIEALNYVKIEGNRWSRTVRDNVSATTDLLVPAYTSKARSSVQVGSVNTTEVRGLAEAFKRDPVVVAADVRLRDDTSVSFEVSIPDVASLLAMKVHARSVRDEPRDALDMYTLMEALAAEKSLASFDADFDDVRPALAREFADDGPATGIVLARYGAADRDMRANRVRALVAALTRR